MPLTLLRRLAESPLPALVDDPEEVALVRTLVLAGYLEASFLPATQGNAPRSACAIVSAVKPLGRWVFRSTGVRYLH